MGLVRVCASAITALPRRKRAVSGLVNNETLLSAEGTKEEKNETFS